MNTDTTSNVEHITAAFPPLLAEWSTLPSVLVERILLFLAEQKDRIRPTRVCKDWYRVRSTYEDKGRLWRRLVRIRVRTGLVVDNITFEYSDGTTSSHGGNGGKEREPFVLMGGQELVEITCREGDALDCVKFDTQGPGEDDRGVSWMYGNERGGDGFIFHEISADGPDGGGPKTEILDLVAVQRGAEYLTTITAVLDCKGQSTHARTVSPPIPVGTTTELMWSVVKKRCSLLSQ